MLDEMRTRTNHAHVPDQHIPELRHFIKTESAEPFSNRINAIVIMACLPQYFAIIRLHGAELINVELSILHPSPWLNMKQRPGGLQTLDNKNNQGHHRKNHQHDRQSNCQVDRAFQETVERIFQWFFAQPNKTESAIFKMGDRVSQFFFQITQDQQANSKLVANPNDVPVVVAKEGKLEQDYLGDPVLLNDLPKIAGSTKNRNSMFGLVDVVIANQTDRAQADLAFSAKPISELGRSLTWANQERVFFPAENHARQDSGNVIVRKKECDIKPGKEIE